MHTFRDDVVVQTDASHVVQKCRLHFQRIPVQLTNSQRLETRFSAQALILDYHCRLKCRIIKR